MDFNINFAEIWGYVQDYGVKIIISLVALYIGFKLAKWISDFAFRIMTTRNMDSTLSKFAKETLHTILIAVVILVVLGTMGVNTTSLVAMLGAVGLAVGLALQGSVANIGASILIMIFRPFRVGDYVEAGGVGGSVELVNLFSTVLITPDNKTVVVPSSQVIGGHITNYSRQATRRVDFLFGVSYGDDIKKVRDVLKGLIESDERILKSPEYMIVVSELADSSVNFTVRVWVKTSDYWAVHFDMIERTKIAFDENGISIPFPQLDLNQRA